MNTTKTIRLAAVLGLAILVQPWGTQLSAQVVLNTDIDLSGEGLLLFYALNGT